MMFIESEENRYTPGASAEDLRTLSGDGSRLRAGARRVRIDRFGRSGTRYWRLLGRRWESAGRGRTDLEWHSWGRPNAIYSDHDRSDDDHEEKEVPLTAEKPALSDETAGES
jgi:hypothetical protein